MADTLITNLTAVASIGGTEEFGVNLPGSPDVDRKVTASQIKDYIQETVFLGEFTATAASTLSCDNIFDESVYDHYIISGYLLPASDNVNCLMDLRTAVPANVGTTWYAGGVYTRVDGGGTPQGAISSATALGAGVGNGADEGVRIDVGTLKIFASTYRHSFHFPLRVIQYTSTRYSYQYHGEFQDTTARQGITFYFSSGNVATGLIRIWGVKKS